MSDLALTKRNDWNERISLAEQIIPPLGQLCRSNDVMISVFGRRLENVTETGIIKPHCYVRRITLQELPLSQTLPILQELVKMDLGAASIDLGALATSFEEEGSNLRVFLERELADVIGAGTQTPETGIVLYGFGRIDHLLVRTLLAREALFNGPRLRAIVVRQSGEDDIVKRTSLLRCDFVHGVFNGTISVDRENSTIWANGTLIQVIYPNDPVTVDYTAYDVNDAIVIDSTGRWHGHEGLSQHLQSKGTVRVLLAAPSKGDVKNIVYGIDHNTIEGSDNILSAAFCTTNGITPVLKVVNDKWGVEFGHVETVHSFINDQNLIDNFHKGLYRGRVTILDMVLTETGVTKAVVKALPEFEGKLTGNAVRVPTPDVSMAVLNPTLDTEVDRDEVSSYLREASPKFVLRQRIDYIHSPEVAPTDSVGSTHAGIVDGLVTTANGKHLVFCVWYDSEPGYSNQVIRIAEEIAGARPRVYPKRKHIDEL